MTPQELTVDIEREGVDRDCTACNDRIVDVLRTHEGIVAVESVGKAQVSVSYDADRCSPNCIDEAISLAGGELHDRFAHETVTVDGMDCSSCAQTIERAVSRVDGVTSCSVNFQSSSLQIEFDRSKTYASELTRRRVRSLGFDVPSDEEDGAERSWAAQHRHEIGTAAAAALTALAFISWLLNAPQLLEYALYTAAILVGGVPIARSGIVGLITTRRPDMKLLMTIAVIGAVAIDAWLEAALVVVLFSVGEALESYAVNRARSSLKSLVEMVPTIARVVRDGEEQMTEVSRLQVGEIVIVLPGEQIPADGTITDGSSSINQASITGESVPVDKTIGDEAFAGTLNGEARLRIEVTSAPGDTTLDRIAQAVTDAQAQKAPSERWVDAFAAIYTPAVMLIAFLVMAAPPLLFNADGGDWFYRGLTFLLLACPCALVISTPVAIVSALGRASASGVLVKGGQHLEAAAGIKAVGLDKTGTITAGRPVVAEVATAGDTNSDELVGLTAAVERGSEHPLAAAIVAHAVANGIAIPDASDVEASRGYGVTGSVNGDRVLVGSARFFADHPESSVAVELGDELSSSGHTVVVIANESRVLGAIGLRDVARPTSKEAVAALHAAGVQRVAILTGDHAAAASAIAADVGIDDVFAELLPSDKVNRLAELERTYGSVAMVGDGVNDAPALARASVGVAMGTGGSATAIETADVALIGDDLRKLAGTIGLARWTQSVVRQNIGFSLGTKAIAAVLALFGLVSLWMAVVVDVGATMIVVANGLRLLRGAPSIGRLRNVPLLDPLATVEVEASAATHDHAPDSSCCSSDAKDDTAHAHSHSHASGSGDGHDHGHERDHQHEHTGGSCCAPEAVAVELQAPVPATAHAHSHAPKNEDEGGCCGGH